MVLFIILGWYTLIRPLDYYKRIGVKQTNPWPLLGDQWPVVLQKLNPYDLCLKVYYLYSKCRYVGFYQFSKPVLMLRDPELIKELTVKEFDNFTDHRSFTDPDTDPIWGSNLFSLKGQKWKEMRATLSGTFTSSKMKHMFDTINDAAENFVNFFLSKNLDLVEVETKDTFTRYTNDVIATAAFGIKVNSLQQPTNTFYSMGKQITNFTWLASLKMTIFFTFPKLFKFFKMTLSSDKLMTYFRTIIHEAIQAREEQGIVRKDMIHLLLETRKGIKHDDEYATETGFATVKESSYLEKSRFKQIKQLTNDDITSQAFIFFLAGFDTISTGLSFGLYEIAVNPDVQNRLRKEIQEAHKANNGILSYDSLLKLKYLDNVFSETLRKWPPVPMIDRVCTKPFTIKPKYTNEKPVEIRLNDSFILPIFALHRDPKYFPEPEKFNPERFSDENKDNIVPYSYIPFGSGPRNCIGSRFAILEAKAVLYHLLLHFEVVPTQRTPIPLTLTKTLQPTAKGGFWLGFKALKAVN